jgi:carboxypeptidase D
MAPFDVPHVTHDMILRFMGVNFSAIVEGSARIPSSVGTESKPVYVQTTNLPPTGVPNAGKTPEQDKAMWEGTAIAAHVPIPQLMTSLRVAYYNAGSAALVLVLIFVAVGTFFWCRARRRRVQLPHGRSGDEEDSIPLHNTSGPSGDEEIFRNRKGKERERIEEPSSPAIFDVGDSDDDDYDHRDRRPI